MKEFDYSLVKNPEYFKDGRMEAHSDHITYANVEEASAGETSYRHSLNGIWKFHYARNYGNTIKGFEREDYSCKDWDDIRVPAHIQMEGYDALSMPMCSTHGKDTRIFTQGRFRSISILWQAM